MSKAFTAIDIPEARKNILKSISEYRRHQLLADVLEPFLIALNGKKVDKRVAEKLHKHLVEVAPDLKVYAVYIQTSKGIMGSPQFRLEIRMYEMPQDHYSWNVLSKDDGSWDVEHAMVSDRVWGKQADFLQERLEGNFNYAANKFNALLEQMQALAKATVMPGTYFPVHPLSEYFCYYKLKGIL